MITVAGFNPSIDRFLEADRLSLGAVNRISSAQAAPGGKGLHVAATIAALGERVRLVGPIDRMHRAWFEEVLARRGIACSGPLVEDPLRTCVAVREADGRVTELLEPGPPMAREATDTLLALFLQYAGGSDLAVLAGSLPSGLGEDAYGALVRGLHLRGVRCLVDASGEALRHAVEARPFLIKPNREEAALLAGEAIDDVDTALRVAERLSGRGIPVVVISLGALGAVAWAAGRAHHVSARVEEVVNTVGSGDCLLGGLAVALRRGGSLDDALRLGVACGAANAARRETGLISEEDVERALAQLTR